MGDTDTRDETELQLQAIVDSTAFAVGEGELDKPYDVVWSPSGVPIDMRPPLTKIAVTEADYKRLLEAGEHVDAVRVLIVRATLIKFVYGAHHPRTAQAHLTIAKAYWELRGLAEQALQHATTALTIWKQVVKESRDLADPLGAKLFLANAYLTAGTARFALGLDAEAEKSLLKADKVFDTIEPASRPADMDLSLAHALARVCARCGKNELARDFFQRALDMCRATEGGKPRLQILLKEMSEVEEKLGAKEKSIASLEESRALAVELNGGESKAGADGALDLARAFIRTGDDIRAERCLCDAIEIYVKEFGAQDDRTMELNDELARLLLRTRRLHDAVQLLKRILTLKAEAYGAQSVQAADTHQLFGAVRLAQGKLNHATKHLSSALAIYHHVHGPKHPQTEKTEKMLAALVIEKPATRPRLGSNSK